MSNCDDVNRRIKQLEDQRRTLLEQLAEAERLRRAGMAYSKGEIKGRGVILPDRNREPMSVPAEDVDRAYTVVAASMSSDEAADFAARVIGRRSRPVGSKGQFENYDRLIREVGAETAEDYAKLIYSLGISRERLTPDDYAFITGKYTAKQWEEDVRKAIKELGYSEDDLQYLMANDSAAVVGLQERGARLKIFKDRSIAVLSEGIRALADAMEAVPGVPPPAALKKEVLRRHRIANAAMRHDNFFARTIAQALRARQFDGTEMQKRIFDLSRQAGDGPADEIKRAMETRPEDASTDSLLGRVMDATDNPVPDKGIGDLRALAEQLDHGVIDAAGSLDKDYFNTFVKRAEMFRIDSMLGNPNTILRMGMLANVAREVYAFPHRVLRDGYLMQAVGTKGWREAFAQSLSINAKATGYAIKQTTLAIKDGLLGDAFFQGHAKYNGNWDTYGEMFLDNEELLREVNAILDAPYLPKGTNAVEMVSNEAQNAAMLAYKLQIFTRKGIGRLNEGLPDDRKIPWIPALRAMGTSDEVIRMQGTVARRLADLEVDALMRDPRDLARENLRRKVHQDAQALARERAKMRGEVSYNSTDYQQSVDELIENGIKDVDFGDEVQLAQIRNEFVANEFRDSFETVMVTEEDVKAYRKASPTETRDLTDQQVQEKLAYKRMLRNPDLNNEGMRTSFNEAAETTMQGEISEFPTSSTAKSLIPGLGEQGTVLRGIENTMQGARSTAIGRWIVPFFRSSVNDMLFTQRLGTGGIVDVMKLWRNKDDFTPREAAQVKATLTLSTGLMALWWAQRDTGFIIGNMHEDPTRRNSIGGFAYLGGIPVLNTLFLWQDLNEAYIRGFKSQYDREDFSQLAAQVLSGFLLRGTGLATIQRIFQMVTGEKSQGQTLSTMGRLAGFIAQGFVPHVGLIRTAERAIGATQYDFLRAGSDSPDQNYYEDEAWQQGQLVKGMSPSDPLAQAYRGLENIWRNAMADTMPLLSAATGHARLDKDWLGNPKPFDHARWMPIFPFVAGTPGPWPQSPVYDWLDSMGMLNPPGPLMNRRLNGVGMSPDLQKEYNDIYGEVKGSKLSDRLQLDQNSPRWTINIPVEAVISGKRLKRTARGRTIQLGAFLDVHTRGKTVEEALLSLKNDPFVQRLQRTPALTNRIDLKDMPKTLHNRRPVTLMVKIMKDYYGLLTEDEIERRAAAGTSAAAMDYSKRRQVQANQRALEALKQIEALMTSLRQAGLAADAAIAE